MHSMENKNMYLHLILTNCQRIKICTTPNNYLYFHQFKFQNKYPKTVL